MNENFEKDKIQLIEKIQQRNTIIQELINDNHRVHLLNKEQLDKLENIFQKNEKFKQKIVSNEFEIAIVGLEKAGKSTFANALIKSNILPSAPERCTFTSTRLVSGVNTARVQFYTESQFEKIFQALLKEVEFSPNNIKQETTNQNASDELDSLELDLAIINKGAHLFQKEEIREEKIRELTKKITEIKNASHTTQKKDQISFKSINPQDFENYFSNLETSNPALFKSHVGKTDEEIKDILACRDKLNLTGEIKVFSGDELKTDVFQAYIKGENQGKDTSKPRSVCSIEIESSELKGLDNAIIYDVPGFDSPTKIHIRQTEERLKAADAIILVTNVGTNPSLQGTTLSVITKNTDEDGVALKDKLFVFGNQLDRVNEISQLKGNTEILISDVEKYKIGERKRVFTGSAQKYLSDEKIIPKSDFRHDIPSKIDDIRNALITYYQTERLEILKRKINTNWKFTQSVLDEILNQSDLDENFSEVTEQAKITKSAYKEVEKNLRLSLKKLQDKLKKEIYDEKYFTNKFHQSVDDGNYFSEISEEDFESHRIQSDDSVRLDLAVNKINQNIRSEKHKKSLEEFTHLIKEITDNKTKEIETKILITFTSAICGDNSSAYDDLEKSCKKYIKKITHEVAHSENSFTYLLERFSRDIFDVLLSSPVLSQDRANRYKSSEKEFSYLDSYYSQGKGEILKIILVQKEESLFEPSQINSIKDVAMTLGRIAASSSQAAQVKTTIDGILKILSTTHSIFTLNGPIGIDSILEKAKPSTNIDQVLEEINTDIKNLKKILQVAVIPAANLELAFLNSIDKQVKRLIAAFHEEESLYSGEWNNFISEATLIVKKDELSQISNRIEAHKTKRHLLEKIKNILEN